MVDVRIYKPSRNIMQSAPLAEDKWVVVSNKIEAKASDPLMGWTSSSSQAADAIKMFFESLEEARQYCDKNGLSYSVIEPQKRKVNIHPYAATLMKNPNL